MSTELDAMHSLGRALKSAGEGEGLARAVVEELRRAGPQGREGSKLILLGRPLSQALLPLIEEGGEEVAMLASLIMSAPRSSVPLVGRSGESLAASLERWVKSRESELLERKVMRFRSLVTSAVLGAVMGMLTALGPVVGSLDLGGGTGDTAALVYGAVAMTALGSGMLGAFMSGRRFFVNVFLSLAVFAVVAAAAAPLASLPASLP